MTFDNFIDLRVPLAVVLALSAAGRIRRARWAATKDSDDRTHQQRIDRLEQMAAQAKEGEAEVTERLARIEERVNAESSVLDRIEKQIGAPRR